MLPIPVEEYVPTVLLDFISKGANNSNDPDLLEYFLSLPLPNITENNSVTGGWLIVTSSTKQVKLSIRPLYHKIMFEKCQFQ